MSETTDDGSSSPAATDLSEDAGPDSTSMNSTDGEVIPSKRCVDLIDDMEGAEAPLIPTKADPPRRGAWFVYNDGTTDTQTPIESLPFTHDLAGAPESDGMTPTAYSARTAGSGYRMWGAGMGFNLNNAGCMADDAGNCAPDDNGVPMVYDVTQFQGISFYAKSYGEGAGVSVAFKVVTEGVVPTANGGTCVPMGNGQCDGAHEQSIAMHNEWEPFEVLFDEIAQPSYVNANAIDFDPKTVMALQWQVPVSTNFDFAVDEICFF